MSYEDIILLVKAGYTRDQITAMQAPAQPAPSAPSAQPAPPEQPAPPAPQGIEDLSKMLAAEFEKLNAAITASNIANAQQPPQESVDDILASIINPPQKNGSPYSIKEVKP